MNPLRFGLYAILPPCLIDLCDEFSTFTCCACTYDAWSWYPKCVGRCAHQVLLPWRTQPVWHTFHSSLRHSPRVMFTNECDNEVFEWLLTLQARLLHCEVTAQISCAAPCFYSATCIQMSVGPVRAHGSLDVLLACDNLEAAFSFANRISVRTVRSLPRRKRKVS